MSELQSKYSVPYKVRSYEVDHQQQTTISTICNYFQEAAGLHAQELHFDISDLQKKGLTWILYKLQVKAHKFPSRWESVEVTTWTAIGDGIRAYRDYELHDENGELLAVGLSQWMVLDLQTKRPIKIPDELKRERFIEGRHVLEPHEKSLQKTDGENARLITTASLNDLDMNRHVNNVRYIDWITGYHFSNDFKRKKCTQMVIQYAAETKAGDDIYLSTEVEESSKKSHEINCTLFKNSDKSIIANAKATWL
ncbi:MAG: thioesterase [Balneolaceae bacterium]|nr:thioesterase [Balneolaceae bacterium]